MSEILTSADHGVARITLNRPQALHALNTQMCRDMTAALGAWRNDASVQLIMLDHAPGTRGFCAGGDIRVIADSGASDSKAARDFFFTEYRLNHLLFSYPKPIVAFMDGVTMGGGVGIAMPARHRIATENTTYAMPETGIGLFPDVGGGWYLPRKRGQIGMWLALTGARLKAADCAVAGITTHFVEAAKLDALKQALHPDAIEATLATFATSAGAPKELTPENIERINLTFSLESVEAIFAALDADGSEWAKTQLATLKTKSPQAMKVTFRQMREGAKAKSFADEMRTEYRLGARVVSRNDFQEGVRAIIIDKDNKPIWNPPTLDGVSDALLDQLFAPLPAHEEWSPL